MSGPARTSHLPQQAQYLPIFPFVKGHSSSEFLEEETSHPWSVMWTPDSLRDMVEEFCSIAFDS